MKLLVVVLVVVGIAGLLISWLATTYSRERRSIERYSQTMGVIQKVSEEAGEAEAPIHHAEPKPHIKMMGGAKPPEPPQQRSASRSMPPAEIAKALSERIGRGRAPQVPIATPPDAAPPPVETPPVAPSAKGSEEFKAAEPAPALQPPLVFDERAGIMAAEEEPASWRSAAGVSPRLQPRLGRFAAVAAVILVVALLGFYAAGKLSGKPARSSSPTTAPPKSSSPTTAPPKSSTTTTTSVPSVILPVTSTAGSATYRAPSGSYTVVVSVTAPCWLAQSTAVGGSISWDAVLQPGQSHTFATSGDLVLRTGASTFMNVTLNGVPVKVNSPPGAYDLIFSTTA
ncbi:MAG: DUF4115 domain-containing protein [Actinomycetota bacterium]|nr:DUF4115 domain-containing protein [Actinomycetota bacterium]